MHRLVSNSHMDAFRIGVNSGNKIKEDVNSGGPPIFRNIPSLTVKWE